MTILTLRKEGVFVHLDVIVSIFKGLFFVLLLIDAVQQVSKVCCFAFFTVLVTVLEEHEGVFGEHIYHVFTAVNDYQPCLV